MSFFFHSLRLLERIIGRLCGGGIPCVSSPRRRRRRWGRGSIIKAPTPAAGGGGEGMDIAVAAEERRWEEVALAFVEHYYHLFDTSRPSLAGLYDSTSLLSFEGQAEIGAAAIARRLAAPSFDQCRHRISTVDCEPSPPTRGILVFVSGSIELPSEEHHLRFSQVLQPSPSLPPPRRASPIAINGRLPSPGLSSLWLQMFQLVPTPQGGLVVQNDIFRLLYSWPPAPLLRLLPPLHLPSLRLLCSLPLSLRRTSDEGWPSPAPEKTTGYPPQCDANGRRRKNRPVSSY